MLELQGPLTDLLRAGYSSMLPGMSGMALQVPEGHILAEPRVVNLG